jgi:hypothetical protein
MIASGLLFMSATDEELEFVHGAGMDHVTYILIFFRLGWRLYCVRCRLLTSPSISLAFIIYALIVALLKLYATSGRNAPGATNAARGGAIELSGQSKLYDYERVPMTALNSETHVVGEDE